MAILACQPCLASVVGPAALGALGLSFAKKKSKKTKKKKKSKSKKGGSGYESQIDYDLMNSSFYNDKENREEEMKKECSDFMKHAIKRKSKGKQKIYANESFKHKQKCENGHLESCDYCRKEYLKLIFDDEKTSKSKSKGGGRKKKIKRNYKQILENNLRDLGF